MTSTGPPAGAAGDLAVNQADRERLALPIRQSAWAPLFIGWRMFRRIGMTNLALAAFWIFSGSIPTVALTLAPLAFIVLGAIAVLAWWRRTFSVVGEELTVVHGILQREEMTVPLDRVQSVSIDQHLFHRPIGLVKVRVDTAGSALAEFVVDALDRPTAEALRRVVLASRQAAGGGGEHASANGDVRSRFADAAPVADGGVVLVRRTVPQLIKVGMTQNPLTALVLLGPVLFLLSQISDTFDLDPSDLGQIAVPAGAALVLLLIGGAVLALGLFSVLWIGSSVVAHHNLTVSRTERGLESSGGLVNRRERAASFDRIQAVVTRQNPLQRRVGISTMALPTVGGSSDVQPAAAALAGAGAGSAGGQTIVVPGLTTDEFSRISPLVLTADDHRPLMLDRVISPLAATRWFRFGGVVPVVLATIGLAFVVGWWAVLALCWLPVMWFLSRANLRRWRWGADGETLAVSHGLFTRVDRHLAWRKIQEVDLTQSLFHRRNGLATVSIATAADEVKIPHLPLDVAYALRNIALARVETDTRPFM